MIVLRNLWRRRTRTLLTWVGITIGITAILALTAIAESFLANYGEVMANSDGDLALQAKQEVGASIDMAEAMISDRYGAELKANPEVRAVTSMLYTIVPMPGVPYFVLFGHEPQGFAISRFKVTAGQSLSEVQRVAGKPIMLGKVAADSLNKSVGDTVTIYNRTYRVVAIYETGSVMEDGGAVVSVEEVQRLTNKPNAVHSFWIQLKHPERLQYVQERLQERYPELQVVRSGDMRGTAVWLEVVRPFTWAVALIAALVGGVGMMNATLMSVFERTREIGVLRALGWRGRQVLLMILGESLVLSIAGAACGTLLTALTLSLLGRVPALAGLTQGSLSPSLLGRALAAALVLGTVGGLYPAWRASRLTPVEALRYEGASLGTRPGPAWGGLAFRNLLRQRTRSALTCLGVGIGALAVVAMSAVTESMMGEFTRMLDTAELTIVQGDISDMSLSSISERVGRQIEALPEVAYAAGGTMAFVSLPGLPVFIIGGYPAYSPHLDRYHLRRGDLPRSPGQIMLGWKAAESLRKDIGDTFSALGSQFRITGIYETGSEYEDSGGVTTLRELQARLGKPRQVMFYEVKLVHPEQTAAVQAQLESQFPDLSVSRSAEFADNLPDVRTSQTFTRAITVMTFFIGSVVVMNTMVMSVHERTRELGVLRALGWGRSQILRLIISESLMLTLFSGALGVAAAWLLLRGLALVPALGTILRSTTFTPEMMARVAVLCICLGILGGTYPAWRAMQLLPVEALRYE